MKRTTASVATGVGKAAAKAALGTSKRRWTSLGAAAGVGASLSLPAMGLAAFGGAIALWWGILLLPLVLLGALIGNWWGLLRENDKLRRDAGPVASAAAQTDAGPTSTAPEQGTGRSVGT